VTAANDVIVCHFTPGMGGMYVPVPADSNSFDNSNGHDTHEFDIIPPVGSYAGNNWPEGESIYDAFCGSATLTPTATPDTTSTATSTATPEGQIEICHATGAGTYTMPTVDINGLNGHGDHEDDIIPPNSFLPLGLNWDAEGEAIYRNDCEVPDGTPTPTPTPDVTPTPTSTPDTTPTPTSTPDGTPTPTSTPDIDETPTPTATPTRTATPTATPARTPSPTSTPGAVVTPTPTRTATASPTPQATVTPSSVEPRPPGSGSAGLVDSGSEMAQVIAWLGIAAAVVLGARYAVKRQRR
jgi:hypothetical protein